jgi:hypothetical protein
MEALLLKSEEYIWLKSGPQDEKLSITPPSA